MLFEMEGLLHIHLLWNCVHKYTDINDGIDLLILKWEVVFEIWDLLHTHLHVHLLLNCVHKYTDIHDGIGLLVLKGIVLVERGVYPISISIGIVFAIAQIFIMV